MGVRSTLAGWGAIISLAGLAGCSSDSLFQCQSDGQCVRDGNTGTCQENGYCSFGDTACPTGQRYGDSAPPGLANLCVDAGAEPTSTVGPSTTDCPGGDCSTSTATSTSSAMAESDSTSSPPLTSGDDTSSGGTGFTTGSSSDASTSSGESSSSGGTTTGGVQCPEIADEFNNAVLDEAPWTVVQSAVPLMTESGETLQFAIDTEAPAFAFLELAGRSLSSGYAVAHLTALPQDDVSQVLLRVFGPDEQSVALVLSNNNGLNVQVVGATVASLEIDEGTSEIWLEIFGDAGELNFAYSVNGDDFFELHNQVAPFPLDSVDISIMGGSYEAISSPNHVIAVDDFEYCGQPFVSK